MPNSSVNKQLETRMPPPKKSRVMTAARHHGSDSSKVINALLDVWLGVPGAVMPDGPWSTASGEWLTDAASRLAADGPQSTAAG